LSVEKLAEFAANPPQLVDVRTALFIEIKP
jgi:hypothetical protein